MHSSAPVLGYGQSLSHPVLVFREETVEWSVPETAGDWRCVHERLVALGRDCAAHEREVCRWLLAALRLGVHRRAGHGSLREYAERTIGLHARQTEERLRVGGALGELPRLDAAFASGLLRWSTVRELTRIATSATEAAWVDWAKHRRAREVERAVATRRLGERPDDRADPSRVRHRLAFAVRAETIALFRDLQSAVRADLGGEVDDDTVLFEIARRALGGAGDDGRANYQVAVSRCDECRGTSIDAGGRTHHVDEAVAGMVACDGQEVGPVDQTSRATACAAKNASPHVGARRVEGGPHVGETSSVPLDTGRPVTVRASQTIPPATRRGVIRRDHKRCVVPGCHHHRFLDVHHLDPRAEGGGHDPDCLAVLCGAHHRAVHAGWLSIDGSASSGFAFRHGDGREYGAPVSAVGVEVVREVLGTLEHLGFQPTRARALVDEALRSGEPRSAALLLQAALRAT